MSTLQLGRHFQPAICPTLHYPDAQNAGRAQGDTGSLNCEKISIDAIDGNDGLPSGGEMPQPPDAAPPQLQQPSTDGLLPQPPATVKSGPASSAEGALNGMRAELAAMRHLLQLRLPPRPPTPASPLVPAAIMDSATGAELASAYHLPPSLSPDSVSAVALRASILEEVRSVVRDALATALPHPLRRAAGPGVGIAGRRATLAGRSEPPAPRVLSVMAHRGDPAPWRGWSPSPTKSARPPRSPAAPGPHSVDSRDALLSSVGDQTARCGAAVVRPSAPPPSPIRPAARGRGQGAQSGAGQRRTIQLDSIESLHGPPPPAAPRLVKQGPTSGGKPTDEQQRRPASTGQMGLDMQHGGASGGRQMTDERRRRPASTGRARQDGGVAAGNISGACACAD